MGDAGSILAQAVTPKRKMTQGKLFRCLGFIKKKRMILKKIIDKVRIYSFNMESTVKIMFDFSLQTFW